MHAFICVFVHVMTQRAIWIRRLRGPDPTIPINTQTQTARVCAGQPRDREGEALDTPIRSVAAILHATMAVRGTYSVYSV